MSETDPYPVPTSPDSQNMLLAMLGRDIRLMSSDVRNLASTMATKVEMEAVRSDLHRRIDLLSAEFKKRDDSLSLEMERKSLGSSLERFLSVGTRLITFCLVLVTFGGLVVGVVKYFDRIPVVTQNATQ